MRIEAGSHGVLESLPRLIDASTGSVYLRLIPHHLGRLHAPEQRGDFVPCDGDPNDPYKFPLLRGTGPVDVTLRGGMSLQEVGAGLVFELEGDQWSRSWWRWIAYALTPFGWVFHPTPEFIRKRTALISRRYRLAALTLNPSCGKTEHENLQVADDWLRQELGPPTDSREWMWDFAWGSVSLGYESRDGAAEVAIGWEPHFSQITQEIADKLKGQE